MAKRTFVNYTAPPIDADICNAWQNHVHDGTDADGHNSKIDAVDHVDWGVGASLESVAANHADAVEGMPTLALRGRGFFASALKALVVHVKTKAQLDGPLLLKNILLRQDGSTPLLKIRHRETEEDEDDNVTLNVHKVQVAQLESSGLIKAPNVPIAFATVSNAQQSSIYPTVIFGTVEEAGTRSVRCVGASHMIAIPIEGQGATPFNVHVTSHGAGHWSWTVEGTVIGLKLQLLFF